jgi:hypothetical protein
MAFDQRWLVWAAIGVLAVVLLVSLVQRRSAGGSAESPADSEGDKGI